MTDFDAMMVVLNKPGTWVYLLLNFVLTVSLWRIGLNALEQLDERIHHRLHRTLAVVWTLVALYVLVAVISYVIQFRFEPLFAPGGAIVKWFGEAAGRVVAVLVLATVAWNLVNVVSAHVVPATEFTRRTVRVSTLKSVVESTLRVVIVVVVVVSILDNIGVETRTLLAGVSVLGLAVSFGAQSLIKDVITGFFILLEDQYGVGDVVTVNNNNALSGAVERMNLRFTALRGLDGTLHIIPNGQVSTVSVMSKDWSRVVASITLPPTVDVNHAIELLTKVSSELHADPAWHLKFLEPPTVDGVTTLTKDGFDVRALFKVLPKEQWPVGREFNRRMKLALDEAGLGGLRPQLMVVRQEEGGQASGNPPSPFVPAT